MLFWVLHTFFFFVDFPLITNLRRLITRITNFMGLITQIIKVSIQDKVVMKTSVLLNGGLRNTIKKRDYQINDNLFHAIRLQMITSQIL